MEWHPKGTVILAGSADGTLWMWNVPSGTCMNVFTGHSGPVSCGGFTPNGKHIISGSEDGCVFVWDPKTATIIHKFGPLHEASVNVMAMHPESQLVLTGAQDGTAKLIHIGNGRVCSSFPCDFNPDICRFSLRLGNTPTRSNLSRFVKPYHLL